MKTHATSERTRFLDNGGKGHDLPLFMPVYQPREATFQLAKGVDGDLAIKGLIVNAFFLYKQRELREKLTSEMTLSEFVGFDGLISTDSGAFQGFTRRLYLKNRDIVRFQDQIRSDVIAPLDLITPPGDSRSVVQSKAKATNKRIREALDIVEHGIVAGVQQGGRFLDERERSTEALLDMGVRYIAIGSLVPFFNKNHDLAFAGKVIRKAREMSGPAMPMHIYGAGDPLELPFFYKLGANIFDSASYGHYAAGGFYMTRYGALNDPGPVIAGEYACDCPQCRGLDNPEAVFADKDGLTLHNLWTICQTVEDLKGMAGDQSALDKYLEDVMEIHGQWFPDSQLGRSWDELTK